LEFDGWHCLSKKQNKEILNIARERFVNANFIDKIGLVVEDHDESRIHDFCLETLDKYKKYFRNWDGYNIKKISKRILYNYADKKRKLKLGYFKKLVKNNKLKDIQIILAGTLYLDINDIKDILMSIESEFDKSFDMMRDRELEEAYRILLMYSSSRVRKFSLI